MLRVNEVSPVHVARTPSGKPIVTLYEASVANNGSQFPYYFFARGDTLCPHADKRPDAVVVVGILNEPEPRIVLVDEFRPPLGVREISFPAGLIDPEDYVAADGIVEAGIKRAARREFKEETGMELVSIVDMSPINIYSSAGLTNESSVYVFGYATGTPSAEFLDKGEDIRVITANRTELRNIMDRPEVAFSRAAWPFLWFYRKMGIQF